MAKYLSITLFCLFFSAQSVADKVDLRLPPNSPEAQYIKEVLTLAYKKINYDISWLEISGIRELELANNNEIDGALARAPAIEQEFPDLIKIPYPLLNFQLLKISNRHACGYCLNQDIKNIAYAKSSRISSQYIEQLSDKVLVTAIVDPHNLFTMLKKSRVDTILVMNFQIPKSALFNPNFVIEVIEHELDYHYLAPQKKELRAGLLNALRSLDKQGKLAQLKTKYQINSARLAKKPNTNKLTIISPRELSLANNNSISNHDRIVDKIFGQQFLLNKQPVNWKKLKTDFDNNKADIITGVPKSHTMDNTFYSEFHLNYLPSLIAFGKTEESAHLLKSDISSLQLCSEISPEFISSLLNITIESINKHSLDNCIEKLNTGKTDAIVIFTSNFNHKLSRFRQVQLTEKVPLFIAFRANKYGKYLKQLFDKQVKQLALEGHLKQMYASDSQYKQAFIRPE